MKNTEDITQNLEHLGFDKEEIEVYLSLLTDRTMTVLEISRQTNIKRTTVYRTIYSLKEKGIIEEVVDKQGTKVRAVHPAQFNQILESKRQEYEKTSTSIKNLTELVQLPESELARTQVRYYQGKAGMKQILWNTLHAKKDIYGESLYEWVSLVGETFLDKYNQEFSKRKLNDYALITEDTVSKVVKKFDMPIHHQPSYDWVRVISKKKLYISGDTIIYNNIFATIFWKHGEIVGIEMENDEFAKMQLSLFKLAWETAIPLKKWLNKNKYFLRNTKRAN